MRTCLHTLCLLLVAAPGFGAPRNVAGDARVSASDSFSDSYLPQFAVDDVFPEMASQDDVGRAWCVDGVRTGGRATFTFEWAEPTLVAEVIYYGRTCWLPNECFREYRLTADGGGEPLAEGTFQMNAGAQRVPIEPRRVSRLTLEFLSSYGGNPGAVEIQVWTQTPSTDLLPRLKRLPTNVALSAEVTASSEHSEAYRARHAVDGVKPIETGGVVDVGGAWAVRGADWGGSAVFTMAWAAPTRVAELVYWGRTAFALSECFGNYRVLADGDEVASGSFVPGIGPQFVPLPERDVRELVVHLEGAGGANPGAAEIEVYDARVDRSLFPEFLKDGWRAPDIDPGLQEEVLARGIGVDQLLVIQRHETNPSHVYTAFCEGFTAGGALCVADLTGDPPTIRTIVPSPEGQILDCDLSYDGSEVVFSWRRTPSEAYHVYRVGVDGSGLTQLTSGEWHDYNACWLPDGGIAFLSTRAHAVALCFTTPAGVLHRMERDGSGVRQLSYNYVNDFTPSVLADGRILYSRWEYVDRPAIPIQSLWTVNPDGTRLSVYYGNRVLSPASFLEAREIPGTELLLCTLTAHNGPVRGGIGIVDRRLGVNAQEAITNLTPQVDIGSVALGDGNHVRGGFESPFPISTSRFLASGKGSIWVGDTSGRWAVLLPKDGPMGWYGAQPVRPRSRPMEATGPTVPDEDGWAALYLVDVYEGLVPHVQRGEVERIAVIQEMAKPLRTEVLGFGFQRPVISCGATYATKKVWGFVPVAEDGSAYFRVPSGVPLYFEALDAEGRAVQRMRSFTHLQSGETQGCIGCHEPRESAAPVTMPAAVRSEPDSLTPPPWGLGEFDYARMVQPILDAHCGECHAGTEPSGGIDLSGDKTDWFNVSYDELTRGYANWIDTRNGMEHNIPMITPRQWGSPVSRLADVIIGGHPDPTGAPRVALGPDERQTVLTWIDLNVPYYSTYLMADESAEGGRRVYPSDLDALLAEVATRRCLSCHPGGVPREGYLRIQNVERNSFLSAPLARAAGGREVCGPVFESVADPDYQALLSSVRWAEAKLEQTPRMDMDGAVAAPCNRSLM